MASFKQWMVGCSVGCLGIALLSIGGCVLFGYTVTQPFRNAVDTREQLVAEQGSQESYTPPPDGVVSDDRVQVFLRVRAAIQPTCAALKSFEDTIIAIEESGQAVEAGEESKSALFKDGLKVARSALGIAGNLGDFFYARNKALLENQMNLGEYTYIYLSAYNEVLRKHEADHRVPFSQEPTLSRRVRQLLVEAFERQIDAAREAGGHEEVIALLGSEVSALDLERGRIPFADGLPPDLDAAFTPHRKALDALYCSSTRGFELRHSRTHAGGISIQIN